MESKRRRDRSRQLVGMFVGEKSGSEKMMFEIPAPTAFAFA